jgi:hypothetical protein
MTRKLRPPIAQPRPSRALWIGCAAVVLLATTGCPAQWGQKYDCCTFMGGVHEFHAGQSKEEIRALFGEPLTIMPLVQHRCAERWMWFFYRTGGGSYAMRTMSVDFDANGKVCNP